MAFCERCRAEMAADPGDERPLLTVTADRHAMTEEAIRLIVVSRKTHGIRSQGECLVQRVHGGILRRAPAAYVLDVLSGLARFEKYDGRSRRPRQIPPPRWLAAAVIARGRIPGICVLE